MKLKDGQIAVRCTTQDGAVFYAAVGLLGQDPETACKQLRAASEKNGHNFSYRPATPVETSIFAHSDTVVLFPC